MIRAFIEMVRRDLRLALRHGSDSLLVVMFFVLVAVLFPLAVGPEPGVLARIGAGVVWVAALLAALLSMDRLFQADFEDGSLDLIVTAHPPLTMLVVAKVVAHWLTTGLPLTVVAPALALIFDLDARTTGAMVLALALGTPALSLVGAIGAGLVLGARRGGVLISLLVLPLFIPVLIFGVAAVEAAATGVEMGPPLLILAALTLLAFAFAPWAAAAAVRQAVG